ncbi:MAG: hypothetical protein Q9212_004197 [Teloschistes hypoglaucus]
MDMASNSPSKQPHLYHNAALERARMYKKKGRAFVHIIIEPNILPLALPYPLCPITPLLLISAQDKGVALYTSLDVVVVFGTVSRKTIICIRVLDYNTINRSANSTHHNSLKHLSASFTSPFHNDRSPYRDVIRDFVKARAVPLRQGEGFLELSIHLRSFDSSGRNDNNSSCSYYTEYHGTKNRDDDRTLRVAPKMSELLMANLVFQVEMVR